MNLPVKVISGPTRREEDGLAMSSRNQYLGDDERAVAPRLFGILQETAAALESGARDYGELERNAVQALLEAGFEPEYISIRRAESLLMPDRDSDELVVLGAARLGDARLIDNVLVNV